jgi:Uma2 family endonuclease
VQWELKRRLTKSVEDEVIRKADAYFEAGVQSCWIVQPALEAVAILVPGKKPELFTTGELTDPATGITVKVDEIFR